MMSTSGNRLAETPAEDFTGTWRYKLGLFMIIIGNLGILVAMVLPFLGVSAGIVGSLVLGGEVVSLTSIIFLGKEGFKAIKSKAVGFVKAGYVAPVGRTRHYIGIAMLCTNVLTSYIVALYLWDTFGAADPEGLPPVVWGLDFAQQESLVFWLFVIGEVFFLASLYVLGADWWERVRKVFVWQQPES